MPSFRHEALVQLLRDRPTLAAELVAATGQALPAYVAARVREADFSQVVPTEFRADLALELVDADNQATFGLVVEVQTSPKSNKRWVWPLYVAAHHARIRAAVCLVVVTPSASIAKSVRKGVPTFQPPGGFVPIVLGPEAIPWVVDEEQAAEAPELAVLSALAHGNAPGGVQVALAAVGATRRLDEDRAEVYARMVYRALTEATRRALEGQMQLKGIGWSEISKKAFAEGRVEGRVEGLKESLLRILEARGLPVADAQRERIVACRDAAVLDRWIAGALTAGSVDDVLG